jgi:periplasmic protein CpxP/Spy
MRQSIAKFVVEDAVASIERNPGMNRWQVAIVVSALFAMPSPVWAQSASPAAPSSAIPDTAPAALPANPLPAIPGTSGNPTNPQIPNPAASDASNPANYGSASTNYASTPPATKPEANPAASAAAQQSGLSETQVASLLQQKGYSRVEVHPDPNSIWVWQAEATKNGRPVTVGIDYRGNVVETSSSQAQPCTSPGVRLGISGGLGAGSQLEQADSCR